MKSIVKTSLGLLIILVLVYADVEQFSSNNNNNIDRQCQVLKCNPTTEVCRLKPECEDSNVEDNSECVYCALQDSSNQNIISENLLASSVAKQQQPVAPRLLARSGTSKLLADNRGSTSVLATNAKAIPSSSIGNNNNNKNNNRTSDDASYDDYYEYDEDETSDKNEFGEEDDYLDDYVESLDSVIQGVQPIRKQGMCPKVVAASGSCDPSRIIPSECRIDTDCPNEQKCCEAACGRRVCNPPIKTSLSICPSSFTCALNCPLGYRTDPKGCLLCECQSCPSMEQCNKNCPSGYLKDLFGCDICECNDQCPPFSCSILCPADVGFAKSSDGCPICQCATSKSKPTEYTSSCQSDVHCPPGFRCLNDARNVPMCQAVSEKDESLQIKKQCDEGLASKCNLKCPNNNYALDTNGCPICKCASTTEKDVIPKPYVECTRAMCRMFCVHGFRRDENGCEICACNDSPQPCPVYKCAKTCANGYLKDYSGCDTCKCACPTVDCGKNCTSGVKVDADGCPTCICQDDDISKITDGCPPLTCNRYCKHGFERDLSGCPQCSCNRCPLNTCRKFCTYGFRKNSEGCDVCDCDWTPVADNIPCSARIPCTGNRVCNLNMKLCELVSADRVNWFVYDFDVKTEFFHDPTFVHAFKSGLINNIATKYGLEPTQITVSSVEDNGMTSFQIMPFYVEDMESFQKKMNQIDFDLNTHEFRKVLPAVAQTVENTSNNKGSNSKWNGYLHKNPLYIATILLALAALIFIGVFLFIFRQRVKYPGRSESKTPIYDTSYQPAPTEDDLYHAVRAPDGTAYVVVESDETQGVNDRRALV